jgi:hypothetical protein
MSPRQPEAKLKRQIKAYFEDNGALVVAIHGGGDPFQEAGISDLLVCHRGLFMAVEIKLPGQKASPRQSRFLRRVRAAGGIGAIVTSKEEAADLLSWNHGDRR